MPSLNNVLAVILGGGRGMRLFPLTQQRSKPAVPIAGKYRLIDIPLSNCINSGIYRVAVLTQFNSVSLHRHISRTYQFDAFHSGWVQIWAAEQTMESTDWYQGTADAVRKQIFEIRSTGAKHVLVLAGDHLYRMDYSQMANFHWDNSADITVAVQPVAAKDTSRFGILKCNPNNRIISFAEKPRDPDVLANLVSRDDSERPYLGSMGIYIFRSEVLFELLNDRNFQDFGAHVIPQAIQSRTVYGFNFDGYWEDIGTIRSYYDTDLMLTLPNPPFNFYDPENPIYTSARYLPGSIVERSVLENVLLADGCWIMDSHIRHSVIGIRSQIQSGVELIDSVLMGADYYNHLDKPKNNSEIPVGIGQNSFIQGAIIDKNACIGKNVTIRPFPRGVDLDGGNWFVRDGIVVIPKNAILEDGLQIAPET